jgi:hypothetical protein
VEDVEWQERLIVTTAFALQKNVFCFVSSFHLTIEVSPE